MPQQKLTDEERFSVLQEINAGREGSAFDEKTVTIIAQDLPFFPGYRFLDIVDYEENATPQHGFFIYKPGDVHVIDWTNQPFYELAAENFVLNAQTVSPYVRLFFQYVRSSQGRFLIIDTIDDIVWRNELPPAARKAVSDMITPLELVRQDPDGSFVLRLCMLLKNALFRNEVRVSTTGDVALSLGEVLIEDMPVQDDILGI